MARFRREAQVLAQLNHPNIAAIHSVEESEGTHFLVMELALGETLRDRIKRGPVPIEEALDISKQIAAGLECAHEKPIVHRDLKPANVKVTPEGVVKILDFGFGPGIFWGHREWRSSGLTDPERNDRAGNDSRYGGLYVAGTGPREDGGQADRHLGVGLRAV